MTRSDAITGAQQMLRSGEFLSELDRRVAYQTESQDTGRSDGLWAYLERELKPSLAELNFESRVIESPSGKSPFRLAEHKEKPSAPTVLLYGHCDVVDGMAGEWRNGLNPWQTTRIGGRVYGRGTADNKGHSINLAALRAMRVAASSASTPNSSSRWARRSPPRTSGKSACRCVMN